jgi:hypothetical protein
MPGAAAVQPRSDGGFADWDYMHGEVEVYNDQGIRITMLKLAINRRFSEQSRSSSVKGWF